MALNGLNPNRVSKHVGMTPSTLSSFKTGQTRNLSADIEQAIADKFGVLTHHIFVDPKPIAEAQTLKGATEGNHNNERYNPKDYGDIANSPKVKVTSLGHINGIIRKSPGGEQMEQRTMDAGNLPVNVALFSIDIDAGRFGRNLPGGTVIGGYFKQMPPHTGELVVLKIIHDEEARYEIAKLSVDDDDQNHFFSIIDEGAEIQISAQDSEEIVGTVIEVRLGFPALRGRVSARPVNIKRVGAA